MSDPHGPRVSWLNSGREGLSAMLEGIDQAQHSVALEVYILQDSPIGLRFRDSLAAAARRGVRVRVLVDAVGSLELPRDFLDPVLEAGGDCRWFNPLELGRLPYRDHRKLLIVDESVAYLGGFNIGTEYDGDGIETGWRDLGVRLHGEWVGELLKAFYAMFGAACFRHRRLARFRRSLASQRITTEDGTLLFLAPGRARNPVREALVADLAKARRVRFTTAYFLPGSRLRNALARAARRGAVVQVLLPGVSDVKLAQFAARGQYSRLLRAGVEIFEFQPSILHAKRYLADDVVYVGSANLDLRSLNINYELLVRIEDPRLAAEGHASFDQDLARSLPISRAEWRRRPWWTRIAERLASAVLVRIDLHYAMRHLGRLRGDTRSWRLSSRSS